MTNERSVTLVAGHVADRRLAEAAAAGLTETVAVVLSTDRAAAVDMVLDHSLWLACMEAVGPALGATSIEVYGYPERRLLERFRRRRRGALLTSLDTYAARLRTGSSVDDWDSVVWRSDGELSAVATCERWYLVGGPRLYHDSYTTCVFVRPADRGALIDAVAERAAGAGGCVEKTSV